MNPTEIEEAKKELTALVPVSDKPTRRVRNAVALEKAKQAALMENAPDLLQKFFASLVKGVEAGNEKKMELAARVLNLAQEKGGMTINNIQQNANIDIAAKKERSFEYIARKLDARDVGGGPRRTFDAVDAEYEDVPVEGDAG